MQTKIIELERRLADAGLNFKRSCTFRSQAEHNALRKRGRFPLDQVNAAYKAVGLAPITMEENRRPVTWRKITIHTLREAVDYYQEIAGKANYDIKVDADFDNIPDWKEFVQIAEDCGLEAGGRWKKADWPHVQWKD
jgi:hypothetical protein